MAMTDTREQNQLTLPPAGTYAFDEHHTSFGFVARHMISKVRGTFTEWSGTVEIAERPEDSHVKVELKTDSITTNNERRDGHLRSADFFQAEDYPVLAFESTVIRPGEGNAFTIEGNLTVKDVTNPVTFDAVLEGWGPGLQEGTTMAAFSARTTIDREDWDLTWNMAVETGGFLVGKQVDIEIDAELLLAS